MGVIWYELIQTGELIDFRNWDIYNGQLHTSGKGGQAFVMAGANINWTPHLFLNAEARYSFARANIEQGHYYARASDFNLSGLRVHGGLGCAGDASSKVSFFSTRYLSKRPLADRHEEVLVKTTTQGAVSMTTSFAFALVATISLLSSPPTIAGSQEVRMGWKPYLGCWKAQKEKRAEGEKQDTLCFITTDDRNAVETLTIVDQAIKRRQKLIADGQLRSLEKDKEGRGDCAIVESSLFSTGEQRIYITSEVTCGSQPSRRSTGIMSMPRRGMWVDVRATKIKGKTVVWSRQYVRIKSDILQELGEVDNADEWNTTPYLIDDSITLDDVIEASKNVDQEAVEAWLATKVQSTSSHPRVKAADLKKLHRAGVSGQVIDMMIAVSYPEKLSLDDGSQTLSQNPQSAGGVVTYRPRPSNAVNIVYYDPHFDPYGYYYYGPYGYTSYRGYYYPRYSYGYMGGWRHGYSPVIIRRGHHHRRGGGGWGGGHPRRGARPRDGGWSSGGGGGGGGAYHGGGSSSGGGGGGGSSQRKAKPRD